MVLIIYNMNIQKQVFKKKKKNEYKQFLHITRHPIKVLNLQLFYSQFHQVLKKKK